LKIAAGSAWKRLPDATPEAIQASRSIRKFFSGDLYKPVRPTILSIFAFFFLCILLFRRVLLFFFWHGQIESYPPFPGNEAMYLRCQIARIASACVISPAGYYAFENEDGEENEGENGGTFLHWCLVLCFGFFYCVGY
jgi:radial spoke head protein 4A